MITIRDFYILNPVWKMAKSLSVKDGALGSGVWRTVKEAYVKDGALGTGSWRKVYNYNVAPSVGSNHLYWQYALDSEFSVNDQTSGDGLASDLYFTFWSNGNSGTYSISGGTARININNIDTTYTPASYNYTTETRSIFCNFVNGSNIVTTFNSSDLNPYSRTGADGNTYAWSISAPGYTQANTNINRVGNPINATQFTMNKNAVGTGNGIIPTISRTYPSSLNAAYYSHSGYTRMISNYELAVSPGQVYRIESDPTTTGTVGSTAGTGWGMNAYTSGTSGQAVPFGTGSTAFESTTWTDTAARTFNITIPAGHSYLRVGIFISHNSTTSTNTPPSTPQYQRFDYLRVSRVS